MHFIEKIKLFIGYISFGRCFLHILRVLDKSPHTLLRFN